MQSRDFEILGLALRLFVMWIVVRSMRRVFGRETAKITLDAMCAHGFLGVIKYPYGVAASISQARMLCFLAKVVSVRGSPLIRRP
jgi:hypothetical protein